MKFEKLFSWFDTRKDSSDPVLPRLWHGPSTVLPKGFKIPASDLPKYGIDPTHVRKFRSFRNTEEWLNEEVASSYDELQKDSSTALTIDEVRASLGEARRRRV